MWQKFALALSMSLSHLVWSPWDNLESDSGWPGWPQGGPGPPGWPWMTQGDLGDPKWPLGVHGWPRVILGDPEWPRVTPGNPVLPQRDPGWPQVDPGVTWVTPGDPRVIPGYSWVTLGDHEWPHGDLRVTPCDPRCLQVTKGDPRWPWVTLGDLRWTQVTDWLIDLLNILSSEQIDKELLRFKSFGTKMSHTESEYWVENLVLTSDHPTMKIVIWWNTTLVVR